MRVDEQNEETPLMNKYVEKDPPTVMPAYESTRSDNIFMDPSHTAYALVKRTKVDRRNWT